MPVLVVENLRKVFSGGIVALKNISFTVDSGEIYGLVGPNGAGKTTTLRIIATVLEPTSGNVYVNGYSVRDKPNAVRQQISYLPEE
ncbi:MAG: ATP-binding cassette domain-containing protein, partial [Desulfurococcaceae archaeon]